MCSMLFAIVSNTPYWVWILLVYLIITGMEALHTRTVSLYRLAIMPTIFIIWSIVSLYSKTVYGLVMYPLAWAFGVYIGMWATKRLVIKAAPEPDHIIMPGSVYPLLLSCGFFLAKYMLGVTYALCPLAKTSILVTGLDAIVSGLFSGFSFGRFYSIVHKYYKIMIGSKNS